MELYIRIKADLCERLFSPCPPPPPPPPLVNSHFLMSGSFHTCIQNKTTHNNIVCVCVMYKRSFDSHCCVHPCRTTWKPSWWASPSRSRTALHRPEWMVACPPAGRPSASPPTAAPLSARPLTPTTFLWTAHPSIRGKCPEVASVDHLCLKSTLKHKGYTSLGSKESNMFCILIT